MRLININTLKLRDFAADTPPYSITSHRWLFPSYSFTSDEWVSAGEELTYEDLRDVTGMSKLGCSKLVQFCRVSKETVPSVEWIWMDTCCIDKTNSTELGEAINSMFRWYKEAAVCLAYLHDVPSDEHQLWHTSEWFRRGWTLQELLAPRSVVFFDQGWQVLGHKNSLPPYWDQSWRTERLVMPISPASFGPVLNELLAQATQIPEAVLWDVSKAENLSFEERQQWMRDRKTTRPEDMAYCQLGLYGVFLPPIYGEREEAFERLKEAIDRKRKRNGLLPVGESGPSVQQHPSTDGYASQVQGTDAAGRPYVTRRLQASPELAGRPGRSGREEEFAPEHMYVIHRSQAAPESDTAPDAHDPDEETDDSTDDSAGEIERHFESTWQSLRRKFRRKPEEQYKWTGRRGRYKTWWQ